MVADGSAAGPRNHKSTARIPIYARLVPYDQWFRLNIDANTSVIDLKDEILTRAGIGDFDPMLQGALPGADSHHSTNHLNLGSSSGDDGTETSSVSAAVVPSALPRAYTARAPNTKYVKPYMPELSRAQHQEAAAVTLLRGRPGNGGQGSLPFLGIGLDEAAEAPSALAPSSPASLSGSGPSSPMSGSSPSSPSKGPATFQSPRGTDSGELRAIKGATGSKRSLLRKSNASLRKFADHCKASSSADDPYSLDDQWSLRTRAMKLSSSTSSPRLASSSSCSHDTEFHTADSLLVARPSHTRSRDAQVPPLPPTPSAFIPASEPSPPASLVRLPSREPQDLQPRPAATEKPSSEDGFAGLALGLLSGNEEAKRKEEEARQRMERLQQSLLRASISDIGPSGKTISSQPSSSGSWASPASSPPSKAVTKKTASDKDLGHVVDASGMPAGRADLLNSAAARRARRQRSRAHDFLHDDSDNDRPSDDESAAGSRSARREQTPPANLTELPAALEALNQIRQQRYAERKKNIGEASTSQEDMEQYFAVHDVQWHQAWKSQYASVLQGNDSRTPPGQRTLQPASPDEQSRSRSGTITAASVSTAVPGRISDDEPTPVVGSFNQARRNASDSSLDPASSNDGEAYLASEEASSDHANEAIARPTRGPGFNMKMDPIDFSSWNDPVTTPKHPLSSYYTLCSFTSGMILQESERAQLQPYELLEVQYQDPADRIRLPRRAGTLPSWLYSHDPAASPDEPSVPPAAESAVLDESYSEPYVQGYLYIFKPHDGSRQLGKAGLGLWKLRWFLLHGRTLKLYRSKPSRSALLQAVMTPALGPTSKSQAKAYDKQVSASVLSVCEWRMDTIRWVTSERADGACAPALGCAIADDVLTLGFSVGFPDKHHGSKGGACDVGHTISLRGLTNHQSGCWYRAFQRAHYRISMEAKGGQMALHEVRDLPSLRYTQSMQEKLRQQKAAIDLSSSATLGERYVTVDVGLWRNQAIVRSIISGRGGVLRPGSVGSRNGTRNALRRSRLRPPTYGSSGGSNRWDDDAANWSDDSQEEVLLTVCTAGEEPHHHPPPIIQRLPSLPKVDTSQAHGSRMAAAGPSSAISADGPFVTSSDFDDDQEVVDSLAAAATASSDPYVLVEAASGGGRA